MIVRFLALLLLLATPSFAHESRPLFVTVTEEDAGRVRVNWRAPASVEAAGAPYARLDGCSATTEVANGLDGAVLYQCAGGLANARLIVGWPAYNPSVTTLVRVVWRDGAVDTHALAPDKSIIALTDGGAGAAGAYLPLGVSHIFGGVDHLLFLALLAMVAGAPRRIFIAATGFTVAHSLTLALTALGVVAVSIAAVEAAIALSIVFLAAEVARRERTTLAFRRPALVASLFGLAHGAGFASALGEIGLPQTARIPALLFFNIGVEAGQVALLAGALLLLALSRRFAGAFHRQLVGATAQRIIAYGVGIVAAFWTIERSIGAFS
jgi:hypothetical protein